VEAVRLDRRESHHALAGLLILLASLAAGCGGEASPHASRSPCPPAPGPLPSRAPTVTTCRYAVGAARVQIIFDSAPQAWFRWNRAQVERWQAAAGWSHTPSQEPRVVGHVGAGAFWVTGPRELVATDRRRIVTVRVLRASGSTRPRALAVDVARAALRTASS
jgi:hypothetical protein